MDLLVLILPAALLLLAGSLYSVYRWGYYAFAGIVPAVAAIFFKTALVHDAFSLMISALVLGSCAGFLLRGKLQLKHFLIISSLLCAFASYGDYIYTSRVTGVDYLSQSKDQATGVIGSSSMSEADKVALKGRMDQVIPFLRLILPFYFFLGGLFWSSCVYMFSVFIFRKQLIRKERKVGGLELFRLNDYLIFVLIASIAALLVAGSGRRIVYAVSLNTLLILLSLYIVQAFGVIKFFLVRKHLPVAILPSTVILVLLLGIEATVFTAMLLAGCGALDLWADFRKLGKTGPVHDDID